MYSAGEWVKHKTTDKDCLVLISPGSVDCRIEETGKQAYGYIEDGVLWIRSAKQMEDGRFERSERKLHEFETLIHSLFDLLMQCAEAGITGFDAIETKGEITR